MRRYVFIFLIILSILSLSIAPCAYGKMSLSTGVRYDMFTDERSPETIGYEVTFPIGLAYRRTPFVLSLDTAHSSANVYPGDGSDIKLSSFTDTRLSASYGLPNLPVGIIFGVDLNLPTGKERLSETRKIAEAGENHDLFEVDDFGEGFNIDLSIGLAEEFEPVSVGVSGKYLFNGEYDPTQDIADDDLDPGDQVLVVALLKWRASSWLNVGTSVAYSHFTEDKTDGKKTFQEGDKVAFEGNIEVLYHIYRPVRIIAGFQQALQARNKELGMEEKLETEPKNSNGDEFFSSLDVLYEHSPRFTFRVLGDVRYYGESERKSTRKELPFEGKRIRYSFGPGFIYAPNKHLLLNGLAKYFILKQDKDILLDQDTTFRGVNISVGLTYTFRE